MWNWIVCGLQNFIAYDFWLTLVFGGLLGTAMAVTRLLEGRRHEPGGGLELLRIERQHQLDIARLLLDQARLFTELEKSRGDRR